MFSGGGSNVAVKIRPKLHVNSHNRLCDILRVCVCVCVHVLQVWNRVDPGASSEAGEGALLQREGAGGAGEEAQTVGGEADGEVQHVSQSHLPTHGALKHLTSKWKQKKSVQTTENQI